MTDGCILSLKAGETTEGSLGRSYSARSPSQAISMLVMRPIAKLANKFPGKIFADYKQWSVYYYLILLVLSKRQYCVISNSLAYLNITFLYNNPMKWKIDSVFVFALLLDASVWLYCGAKGWTILSFLNHTQKTFQGRDMDFCYLDHDIENIRNSVLLQFLTSPKL